LSSKENLGQYIFSKWKMLQLTMETIGAAAEELHGGAPKDAEDGQRVRKLGRRFTKCQDKSDLYKKCER
jgi:hypothetical protein